MKTWKTWWDGSIAFEDYVHKGDEVDEGIYDYFLETAPPEEFGLGWFLMGEPVDSEEDAITKKDHLLYDLYVQSEDDKYFFIGPVRKEDVVWCMVHKNSDKYESEYLVAKLNRWDIDVSQIRMNGPKFSKGDVRLWKIRDGWQCADLVKNCFCNHRPYKNLIQALVTELV